METREENAPELDLIRSGRNFLGILNDLKRRPEDAAKELGISEDEINSIISGKKEISSDLVNLAIKIWPVNARDFYINRDDCPSGIKIMRAKDSEKSKRIMDRAGKPYYEYRDTVMSTNCHFRPEWIMELCTVEDNEPDNPTAQWNNGHFIHQFTYFIGEVNFYYKSSSGEKKVAIMNTGDSMYVNPFAPHTFTTRKGAKQNGLILALTYGNKLKGDSQQELSSISSKLGSEFVLDFSSKNKAVSSLFKFHRKAASLSLNELSKRSTITLDKLHEIENGKLVPTYTEFEQLANALNVNTRDLLPNDIIENKIVIKYHNECKKWYYPESTKAYELRELAFTRALPYSKAFEMMVQKTDNNDLDLSAGLHQYVYNVGEMSVTINWTLNDKNYKEIIDPGDSMYIKPFLKHNFRGKGKLLILRIGGKMTGDPQIELSHIEKENTERAISETMQWFDPKGKN